MRFRAGGRVTYPLLAGLSLAVGLTVLAGCGGGSSDPRPAPTATPTPTPTPTPPPANPVTVRTRILWGPRSRQIPTGLNAVGGPSSALSAVLTLSQPQASGGAEIYTQTADRSDAPAAASATDTPVSQEYTSPVTVRPGVYFLRARFFADRGGRGAQVGEAAASATVQADGTLSVTIATFGAIQRIVIDPGQRLAVGETREAFSSLGVRALDAQGNLVPITPGSAFVTVVQAPSAVAGQPTITAQGPQITAVNPTLNPASGAQANQTLIRVSVDNAVSDPTPVQVTSSVAITVTPTSATVSPLLNQSFTASVANDGPAGGNGVTFAIKEGATAGSVAPDPNNPLVGVYTAPGLNAEGSYTLVVRSVYDPNVFVELPITVQSLVAVAITPNPVPAPISINGVTFKFSATVANVPAGRDANVTWSVGQQNGGTITADGTYTTPTTPGDYTVIATSNFDPRKSASVTVPVRSVVRVSVTPKPAPPISIRAQLQLRATLANVPAGKDATVTWSVPAGSAGTVDVNGLYTAPATPGVYRVVATSNFDRTQSDFVDITVQAGNLPIVIQ